LNVAGGHVTITGRIGVGSTGSGSVVVSHGATVSSYDAIIGIGDGDGAGYGEALLSSGAYWVVDDQFTVGLFTDGVMRIESGASLVSRQGYVGANSGANSSGNGAVTVTGANSTWEITDWNLNLGNYGAGAMIIEDGARV